MLQSLRKKENMKKIMWTLAALIIPAFILWGAGSSIRSGGAPKYAGKVFGKNISFSQYEASLRAFRNQALLTYGEEFSRVAEFLNLEKEAWMRLILLYQAKKEHIEVSDQEVIAFIQKFPLFHKQGRFDQERYNALLDYAFGVSPREFEEQIRETLKIDKLANKVIDKVSLSDEEIKNVYKNENEKASAFYVLIEPEKFENQIHPSYEELKNYHTIHKNNFRKPEQVNVQYIALYAEDTPAVVEVSEEEILDYYQKDIEQVSGEDKKSKEPIKPFEEVKAQIKEKLLRDKIETFLEDRIWQISDEIANNPASFEEVADKYQAEVKETGFFGPQEVIQDIGLSYEFLNAAFSLKPGQLSNVIETSKGYLIIKVKEKKETYLPEIEEIKEEVEQALIKQKSRQLAKEEAKNVLSQIKKLIDEEGLSFLKAAEKLNLDVKETERFTRSSYISGIGQNSRFNQAAFELKPGQTSEVIAVANGSCILSPKEIIPIKEEKFTKEKEEFAKAVLARKRDVYYQMWLAELKKEAKLIDNITKLSGKGKNR